MLQSSIQWLASRIGWYVFRQGILVENFKPDAPCPAKPSDRWFETWTHDFPERGYKSLRVKLGYWQACIEPRRASHGVPYWL